MKIAIIGAGNVGATTAMRIAERSLGDVVMVDVRKGIARAKALDLSDAAPLTLHESHITGSENLKDIEGSAVVVLTAGFPRQPGMKREELLEKNREIVSSVATGIRRNAPEAIVIVVTNPLDVMTYAALKSTGFPKHRVFGMAGDLDAARFKTLLAGELGVERSAIETVMMGSHGDTMVPVISHTTVSGRPLSEILSKEEIEVMVARTKGRGAEIVSLLGQGSAYYAPSAAVVAAIETIAADAGRMHCVSALLEGEYDLHDLCIGVPAVIGRSGVVKVLPIELSPEERQALLQSAGVVQKTLSALA